MFSYPETESEDEEGSDVEGFWDDERNCDPKDLQDLERRIDLMSKRIGYSWLIPEVAKVRARRLKEELEETLQLYGE